MRRHPNVVHHTEIDAWTPPVKGPEPFGGSAKRLGTAAGNKKLGAGYFSVPAGKTAVPCHAHFSNEEAAYIISGKATVRIGKDQVVVSAGDWIAFPTGEEYAHQIIADQGESVEYLVISTMNEVEVVTYPDSGKLLAHCTGQPTPVLRKIFRLSDGNVGYWEGEGQANDPNTPSR